MAMTPREYLQTYVENNGGVAATAAKLKLPLSTLAGICNGSRGIGKATAQRMVEADPLLDKSVLIWVKAVPSQRAA